MDRLALSLVAFGLALMLTTVATVLRTSVSEISALAGAGASLAGLSIIAGLVMLERVAIRSGLDRPVAKAALPRAAA